MAPKPKSWFVRQKVLWANIHETEGLLERNIANSEDSSKLAKRFIQTMSVVLAPDFDELSVHAQHYQFVNFVVTQRNISISHDL